MQTAASEGRAAEVWRSLQQRHPQLIFPALKRSRRLSLSASRCLQRRSSPWRCASLGCMEGVRILCVSHSPFNQSAWHAVNSELRVRSIAAGIRRLRNELILRAQRQPCLVVSPRSTMVAWQLRRRAFSSWRTSASWRQCAARGTGRWCWASAVQRAPRRWLTLRSARCPAACLSCPRLCDLGAAGMHQLHGRPAPCGSGSCGVLSSTWGSRVAVCGALAPVAFGQHAHTSCLRPLSGASPAARHSLAGIAAPSFLTACLRIVASAPFVHPRGVAFCLAASCALAARE